MNRQLLPIGTVIELKTGIKLIIAGYEELTKDKITYICSGYPNYLITDIIPMNKLKKYKEKYGPYNTDTNIDHDSEYKIIHMGYQNQKFYDIMKKIN